MSEPFRALLIDDETLALVRLERLLAEFPTVTIVDKTSSPTQAIALIDQLLPDLVFLDIQMPGLSGFEVLERINHQPWVIFVTAYDQYALQAFEANSVDYLLKPVDRKRLGRALEKLEGRESLQRIATRGIPEWRQLLDYLKQGRQDLSRKLISRQGERLVVVDPKEVACFYARDKYTFAVTPIGEHLLDYSLQQLGEWLAAAGFLQIHRSFLVNLNWVQELHRGLAGNMFCRLKSPLQRDLPISRPYLKELRGRLGF